MPPFRVPPDPCLQCIVKPNALVLVLFSIIALVFTISPLLGLGPLIYTLTGVGFIFVTIVFLILGRFWCVAKAQAFGAFVLSPPVARTPRALPAPVPCLILP